MLESNLKDLVVGELYKNVYTGNVFILLELVEVDTGGWPRAARGRPVESWKIMLGEQIKTEWLWEGSYMKLECNTLFI
jgi:hypothetical protein